MTNTISAPDPHHDELLSIIHDVKNALFRISSLADLMSMEEQRGSSWSLPYPQLIVQCCQETTEWIATVTDLARMETDGFVMQPEPTNLVTLVRQWAGVSGALARAGRVAFRLQMPQTYLPVRLDAGYFTRVLDNLFSNAVKFTPEGGQVTLTITQEGRSAQLTFRDTGIGIPKALLPHLFAKFSQASRMGERGEPSSGLGLYTARRIVESHRGTITARCPEEGGSVFTVSLPLLE